MLNLLSKLKKEKKDVETFENAKILVGSGSHYENHLSASYVTRKKTEEIKERSTVLP